MVRTYIDEWNNFQFRAPVYIDGHFEPYRYDLVKWESHEPYEVTDWYTGQKKTVTRSCFTIATLLWISEAHYFQFHSCELRYLEHRENGLEEWILDFCEMMKKELMKDDKL